MADENPNTASDILDLATELTVAWLSNPNTRAEAQDVPVFLQTIHDAVKSLVTPPVAAEDQAAAPEHVPAVSVRRSLGSKDHLISLIDGKPYKTLKKHLSGHGLTPAEYRERYKLKSDYPMVAENYAAARRAIAKKLGLGRKPGEKAPVAKTAGKVPAKPAADKAKSAPARRGRKAADATPAA